MSYGERYLKVEEFVSYCKKLNVKTTNDELEYYEQKGFMLPMARVVAPDYLVRQAFEHDYLGAEIGSIPEEWKAIERLNNPRMMLPEDFAQLEDQELEESIDREFGKNPYLYKPSGENFKSWRSYSISVKYLNGQGGHRSTADHYYSYWQVHQLFKIQNVPELYRFSGIINSIRDERVKEWLTLPFRNVAWYRTFDGLSDIYDALSFFITIYSRERMRTLALVPPQHGMHTLNEQQYQEYRTKIERHGASVLQRYSLSEEKLYNFLVKLLDLHDNYEEAEKLKLANQIENDIFMVVHWLMITTTKDWDNIADDLGKRTNDFTRNKLRHLDPNSRMRDVATDELVYYAEHYQDNLKKTGITNPSLSFAKCDANQLIHFCYQNGLDMLAFSLDEMIAIYPVDDVANKERERKSQRTTRYTNLKNLATTLEYFLRVLAQNNNKSLEKLMTPLIRQLMSGESWIGMFEANRNWVRSNNNKSQDFYQNLNRILQDSSLKSSEDGYWAKNFLISCLVRNLSVHTYPTDDWFYGDLMGEMIQAVVYCFLYSWYVAKREAWVIV